MLHRLFFYFFLIILFILKSSLLSAQVSILDNLSSKHWKMETPGFYFYNENKPDYWFKIGARLFLDEIHYSGNHNDRLNQFPSGALVRILYCDITGGLGKNFDYTLSINFVPIIERSFLDTIIRDGRINYTGIKNTNIQFGQVPIPSSLENWCEIEDDIFLDVSLLAGCFFPVNDYGLGIYIDRTMLEKYLIQLALFQPRQELFLQGERGRGHSDKIGEAIRFIYSPLHVKRQAVHFGIWARHQSLFYTINGSPGLLSEVFPGFGDFPEAEGRIFNSQLVNTGPIRARAYDLAGLEFAYLCGSFMLQTEYLKAWVHQKLNASQSRDRFILPAGLLQFTSWYIQAAYILTGESRVYDFENGLFRRPEPASCYGAIEIATRLSYVNLTDRNIHGGSEMNFALGINWFINKQLRLCGNYIYASAHPLFDSSVFNPRKRKLNILAGRIQYVF